MAAPPSRPRRPNRPRRLRPRPPPVSDDRPAKAEEAWNNGRYAQSEALYADLLASGDLSRDMRITALKRHALSALFSGHYQKALRGVENWAQADPTALNTWEWQYRYVQALSRNNMEQKAQDHLARIILEQKAPWPLQAEAAIELFKRYAFNQNAARGAQILAEVHARGTDDAAKAKMEEYLAKNLGDLPDAALAACAAQVNEANQSLFPYALFVFEQARRAALADPEARTRLRELTEAISLESNLADKDLVNRIADKGLDGLSGSSLDALRRMGPALTTGGVAVVLPLGGQFREFGGKVLRGIRAAQTVLAKNGVNLDVTVIDSTQPGWLDSLMDLPGEINIIGGPLHKVTFRQVQASGLLQNRMFLTFLPTLGDAAEGMEAWRFFSGPGDEARSLLSLTLGDYRIMRYGVLRPNDRYGQVMSELFALETARLGGQITATGVYAPNDATGWDEAVKQMVRTDGTAGFGAVFVPDEWNRADGILPYFFYNDVNDLLILGPRLWTEAMTRAAANNMKINIQNYRLAVCPGAWWPDNPAQAARDLTAAMETDNLPQPDFWTALGYDFARFAARLSPVAVGTGPLEFNSRLSRTASEMDWSMAPIVYDASGIASQNMFLFRPSVAGPIHLDPEGFRERLMAIRKQGLSGAAPESEQPYSVTSPEDDPFAPQQETPDGDAGQQQGTELLGTDPVREEGLPEVIILDGPAKTTPAQQPKAGQPIIMQ